MYSLPRELTAHIATYLSVGIKEPGPALYKYAAISRQWQLAIEAQTFQHIRLINLEIDMVAPLLVGQRRHYINEIESYIILFGYDEEHCAK